MRITRPLLRTGALVAALSLGLTACGSGEKEPKAEGVQSAACKGLKSGATSDAVKVTGDFGKEQKATFKTPLEAKGLQRSIVDEGDGKAPKDGSKYDILLTVLSGKTGKPLGAGAEKAQFPAGDESIPKALKAGIECVNVGSRSVVTVPAKDVFTQGAPQGIDAADTLVIVSDVIGVVEEPEPPKTAEWKDAPEVTFDKDGKPTVKLSGAPAKELKLKVLEEGDGQVVKSGDQVTVDYQGTSWDTKQIFDQSYGKEPATFGTDQVVPGFGAALVGQKVGSKVIVTMPPEQAYGPKGSGHQLAGQTLVFVIDIKSVG